MQRNSLSTHEHDFFKPTKKYVFVHSQTNIHIKKSIDAQHQTWFIVKDKINVTRILLNVHCVQS